MKPKIHMGRLQHLLNLALNAAGSAADDDLSVTCRRCAAALAMTILAEAGLLLEPLAAELEVRPPNPPMITPGVEHPNCKCTIVPPIGTMKTNYAGDNAGVPSYLRLKPGELN